MDTFSTFVERQVSDSWRCVEKRTLSVQRPNFPSQMCSGAERTRRAPSALQNVPGAASQPRAPAGLHPGGSSGELCCREKSRASCGLGGGLGLGGVRKPSAGRHGLGAPRRRLWRSSGSAVCAQDESFVLLCGTAGRPHAAGT